MKAMSKFFLIIAAVLLAIGAALMIIGSVMAKNSGIQLFQEKHDGKYLYSLDLSDKEITKVSIDATDTDITLKTGEDRSYIEFINFNENYYSIKSTNKVVEFEEHVSLSSLISFWDGNFKFKGMRSFLSLGSSMSGQKEVIIHMTDTSDINVFSFTITDGDIVLQNAESNTDYTITMDTGNVTMSNITTQSKVQINGNNCSVKLENCSFRYFESNIDNVELNADIHTLHTFDFTGKSGKVLANLEMDTEKNDIIIRTESEQPFKFNNEEHTKEYLNNIMSSDADQDPSFIHVKGEDMTIEIIAKIPETPETEAKQ